LPRFRDITAFVRRKPLFQHPTPILAKISGCSPWSRPVTFGLQRANMPGYLKVKLFSKISNLCDHNSPTLQTDRRTDGQTTCDRNTALCTKVHRAVKIHDMCVIDLQRKWPLAISK